MAAITLDVTQLPEALELAERHALLKQRYNRLVRITAAVRNVEFWDGFTNDVEAIIRGDGSQFKLTDAERQWMRDVAEDVRQSVLDDRDVLKSDRSAE